MDWIREGEFTGHGESYIDWCTFRRLLRIGDAANEQDATGSVVADQEEERMMRMERGAGRLCVFLAVDNRITIDC